MIRIREFRTGDEPALFEVFYSAVHDVACRHYTQEQVDTWAPRDYEPEEWAERVQGIQPFVAEEDGRVLGYADVQADGYIDHFFVSGAAGRRGVGRALMERLHERAGELGLPSMHSHVSLTAQPFFAHFGFEIVEQRRPVVDGVEFSNALMRTVLRPIAEAGSEPPMRR
jgi:putative acetyltransferase